MMLKVMVATGMMPAAFPLMLWQLRCPGEAGAPLSSSGHSRNGVEGVTGGQDQHLWKDVSKSEGI